LIFAQHPPALYRASLLRLAPRSAQGSLQLFIRRFCSLISDKSAGSDEASVDSVATAAAAVSLDKVASSLASTSTVALTASGRAQTLADLANSSSTLSQLMSMGVDLSRAERCPGAAPLLLSLDYETEFKPRFQLLLEFGCLPREAADIVSAFPSLLATPLPVIRDRLDYFQRAGFVRAPEMLSRQPTILSMSPESVDSRLARLQRLYLFSNAQLVSASTECPKIITFPMEHLAGVRTCLVKGLQLGATAARKMAVLHPPLMVSEQTRLYRNFALLTSVYKLHPDLIASNPLVLVKQPQRVAARLKFLTELNRAQFDPQLPLYTSLTKAVTGSDAEFCNRVADCSPARYRAFLKTL
uniref:mTERF domain-containing protein 1, mitochondrial n=2 Tax=Macrostomum lignano TaxID=282301 RepID=A0A1I8H2A8_9PLAT